VNGIVRNLPDDQRTVEPGIYVDAPNRIWGVKPLCSSSFKCPECGRPLEVIPFSWATEHPPLGEFIMRFPSYWKGQALHDVWLGEHYNPLGIYWNRIWLSESSPASTAASR
jgi:hypothetical protein